MNVVAGMHQRERVGTKCGWWCGGGGEQVVTGKRGGRATEGERGGGQVTAGTWWG